MLAVLSASLAIIGPFTFDTCCRLFPAIENELAPLHGVHETVVASGGCAFSQAISRSVVFRAMSH
jgi:hypothetical protein